MTRTSRRPDTVDSIVSSNIRANRIRVGLSQEKMAASIGITFQMQQKYEGGKSRVSAGRLWQIARALGVSVHDLYKGADEAMRAAK